MAEAFPGALALCASVLTFVSLIGLWLNGSIVYVTVRAKLRGTCHFLLALIGVFEVLHQCSHFVFFYVVVLGSGNIPYSLCIWLQAPSTMGLNALQLTLLATAFDRLISARAPVFYKMNNDYGRRKALYLGVFSVAIFGYGLFSAGYSIWLSGSFPSVGGPSTCDITDTFANQVWYVYFSQNTMVLDIICAVLYVFMWLGVRHFQATDMQRRLLRSLITIVVVNVGGYFINLALMYFGRFVLVWPGVWYETQINGILLNIAAASNAPILYWMSTEYRKAYNEHLVHPLLRRLGCFPNIDENSGGERDGAPFGRNAVRPHPLRRSTQQAWSQ